MSKTLTESKAVKLPTFEEVDQLTKEAFPSSSGLCQALCQEYQDAANDFFGDTPAERKSALALMKALSTEMRQMNCPRCLLT